MKTSPLIRSILAISVPAVCFFAAWSLARKQVQTIDAGQSPVAKAGKVVVAEESDLGSAATKMTLLPEWNLIAWRAQLERLSAPELRDLISNNLKNLSDERRKLAFERLGALEGLDAILFAEDLANADSALRMLTYHASNGWVKSDPRGALLAVAKNPELWRRRLGEMVMQIAMFDVNLAAELIEMPELADPNKRPRMIAQVSRFFGSASSQDAFRWFESLPETDRVNIGANLFGAHARRDPIATAAMIAKLPPGQVRLPALTVAASWAAFDPKAALEWSESLPQSDLAWDARRVALMEWANSDSTAALGYIQSLGAEESRALFEEPLASGMFQSNPTFRQIDPFISSGESTLADVFLKTLPAAERQPFFAMMAESSNRDIRNRVRRVELFELAKTDPAAAIAETAGLDLGNTRRFSNGVNEFPLQPLLESAASGDPAAAFELARTFPDDHRKEAVNAAVVRWADSDPAATEAYLVTMAAGRERDELIRLYVRQVAGNDPRGTAEFFVDFVANNEMDSGLVRSVSEQVIGRWFQQDPRAAGDWVAGLTDRNLRGSALGRLYREWQEFGDDVAIKNLTKSGFSAEEIGELD